jgi:hypothetical protein
LITGWLLYRVVQRWYVKAAAPKQTALVVFVVIPLLLISRLEEEDIENVPNMASAEIVDLMISTRFPPERIIDWVDQAILFTYLGPDKKDAAEQDSSRRELLRRQGIRTATSLIHAFDSSQERYDKGVVEKILSDASGSHIRSLLDAIGTDSNVSLVCAWRKTQVCA